MGSCVGVSGKKQGGNAGGGHNDTPAGGGGGGGGGGGTAVPTGTTDGFKGEIKMLLLGAGESGKSTIWKQMKLIHLEGFTDEDLQTLFKPASVENVVQLLQGLLICARDQNLSVGGENMEFVDHLLSQDALTITYRDFADKYTELLALWHDPIVQSIAKDPDAKLPLVLQDSASYWYKHIERILQANYTPTIKDIIKTRTKTTGIQDIVFEIEGYKFKLTDVGGQRSERKKWIACFQNLTAILFVVALSEYDQVLNEDSGTNRMTESLKLFRGVVGNDALHHVTMILFLNKEDLFTEKIKRSDLKKTFPDYDGPQGDKEAAFEYIKNQFISLNTNPNRKIYTQITVATDRDNIRQAMDSVKDIVIEQATSSKTF